MVNTLFSRFWKFIATKEFISLIVFLILAWALLNYTNNKTSYIDGMDVGMKNNATDSSKNLVASAPAAAPPAASGTLTATSPTDLLPSDQNSEWAALNPVNNNNPAIPDLLQAGYHIGLDTIGQTLRNPNYQLRSDPVIPKAEVGPWNMSTIEPDLGRVPLEVGCGGK
jgi:hypothetical protein